MYASKRWPERYMNEEYILKKWGGKANFIHTFKEHYVKMMIDPFMNSLFNVATTVPPEVHGKRLALFFLYTYGCDSEY